MKQPLFAAMESEGRLSTFAEFRPAALPNLSRVSTVYLDTETTGLKWWDGARPVGIALGWYEGNTLQTCYLPFGHVGGNRSEDTVRRWARAELRGKRIVGHNTRFDIHMLRVWGVDLREQGCTFSDVSHTAALLDDHRQKFNLDALAEAYLGMRKLDLEATEGMAHYHAAEVEPYACRDIELTAKLERAMAPDVDSQDLGRVKALEERVIPVVVEMEGNACPLDMEKLERWVKSSKLEEEKLLLDLQRMVGFSCNPGSPKDMERLFLSCGVPILERTPTGKPSFPDAVLVEAAKQHPQIALARRAKKMGLLRSKFLLPYWERNVNGYLRYHLNQLRSDDAGTVSGRFSSTEENIQQVFSVENQKLAGFGDKYLIRELFIPAPGKRWVAADMAQVEYRLFAHYANDPEIIAAYRKDQRLSYHKLTWELLKEVNPSIGYKPTKNANFACFEKTTPILTAGLEWKQAGDLKEGDQLLAFSENQREGVGRAKARRWEVSTVLRNALVERECLEVELDTGERFVTTPEHKWIRSNHGGSTWHYGDSEWIETQDLHPGMKVKRILEPWRRDTSYEAGWLAGFADGEGCASKGTVSIHQNRGTILEKAYELLARRGLTLMRRDHDNDPRSTTPSTEIHVMGNVRDRLRFLGEVQPTRLVTNFVSNLDGRMLQYFDAPVVVAVRPAGKRLIAALETSSRTYIAAGYAAHNCIYGAGNDKLALMIGMSVLAKVYDKKTGMQVMKHVATPEAHKFIATYRERFPAAPRLLAQAMDVAEKRGYVKTLFGRRCRFPKRQRLHKALNAIIQGGAGDLNKLKLCETYDARKELDYTMRITNHDEIGGDSPSDDTSKLQALLDKQTIELRIPILWEIKAAATWADCK